MRQEPGPQGLIGGGQLIQLLIHHQRHALIAGIGGGDHEVGGQGALNVERPLLLVGDILPAQRCFKGIAEVDAQSSSVALGHGQAVGKRTGKGITGKRNHAVGLGIDRCGGANGASRARVLLPGGGRMMEDSGAGVDDGLVVQPVGDAQARIEVELTRILQLPAGAAQARNADAASQRQRRYRRLQRAIRCSG